MQATVTDTLLQGSKVGLLLAVWLLSPLLTPFIFTPPSHETRVNVSRDFMLRLSRARFFRVLIEKPSLHACTAVRGNQKSQGARLSTEGMEPARVFCEWLARHTWQPSSCYSNCTTACANVRTPRIYCIPARLETRMRRPLCDIPQSTIRPELKTR
ncbi:Uncharacterized protein HZ326_18723 [Fusarium oxysporum f. sp. albedinis]|nr:Uncharacterized protein HZ326_18723 [Fusarium oxysporum f. sp. albedinis]